MADALPYAEQMRQRFTQDLAALLGTAEFRRFLWHLIDDPEWCRAHGLSSVHRQSGELLMEPLRIYFAEGRRSIGMELEAAIRRIAPQKYMQMLNEAMGIRNQQPSPPVQVPPQK